MAKACAVVIMALLASVNSVNAMNEYIGYIVLPCITLTFGP